MPARMTGQQDYRRALDNAQPGPSGNVVPTEIYSELRIAPLCRITGSPGIPARMRGFC
jgi:hypothetical protein